MRETVYEVLVCVSKPVRGLEQHRWYLESMFHDLAGAQDRYDRVSTQWPHQAVVVILVRSDYDEMTQAFRDRVLRSRDKTAMFARKSVTQLSPQARQLLTQLFGQSVRDDDDLGQPRATGAGIVSPTAQITPRDLLYAGVMGLVGLGIVLALLLK